MNNNGKRFYETVPTIETIEGFESFQINSIRPLAYFFGVLAFKKNKCNSKQFQSKQMQPITFA